MAETVSTMQIFQILLSTTPLFTKHVINSIDMVTQREVFRQVRDTTGICLIIIDSKILLFCQCD